MPIDMSLAKAPPKKTASGTRRVATSTSQIDTRSVNQKRNEGLLGLAQVGQGILLMVGQYADAAAIGQHWRPVAQELANVADTSDFIAKPIDFLIEVGPYGGLVAALLPLGLQIAANHGWVDATKLVGQGVVPPDVLEAQMKAQVAKMQADAMRAQQEALMEARKAQAEYEKIMAKEVA